MSMQQRMAGGWVLMATMCIALSAAAAQQPPATTAPQTKPALPGAKITAEQATQLFGLVDELIKFSSTRPACPSRAR